MAVGNEDQIKFVLGGHINGSQSWSVGIWAGVSTTGTPTAANLDSFLTTWESSAIAMWLTVRSRNLAAVVQDNTSAYFYPVGSNVATLVAHHTQTASPGTGSQGSSPRQSLVVSLLTGAAGRSRRGRIYLPFTGIGSTATLQAATADVDAITNAVATLFTAMKTMSGAPAWGNCPPRVRSNKTSTGYIVTSVAGNSLIDTQRRREDKLAAAYTKTVTI